MRILVTYGWYRTTYVVVESLAQAGWEVYACGFSPLSMSRFSRYVSGFDFVPSPFEDAVRYVEELATVVRRRNIDLLLPMHEDALAIQEHRDRFPEKLIIAAPPHDDLVQAMDKYSILEVAERAGVPTPRTILPSSVSEADSFADAVGYPIVIKTRRGNSGKGVFICKSREEAASRYRELTAGMSPDDEQRPLVQEFVSGSVFGCCILASRGEVKACFTERYLRCMKGDFGTSIYRERCDVPLLEEYASEMARELNWTGIGQFDFIVNDDRTEARLLEMNPRFWGALNLAVQNGFDFPRGLVSLLTSGAPDLRSFEPVGKPVRSLWILGELMSCLGELKSGNLTAPFVSLGRIAFPQRPCSYDDFRWRDPIPFLVESAYYARAFLSSNMR